MKIPTTAAQAFEVGYLDCGGEICDKVTGPSTITRSGYLDLEADGKPPLRIRYSAAITFEKPYQPRKSSRNHDNVIEMPLRKAS